MSRTSSLEIISHKGELPSLDHTRLRKIRKKYLYKFNELWVWYLFATIFYKKIVLRLYDVNVSTFTAQKKLSLQSNFGTNWATLLRKKK